MLLEVVITGAFASAVAAPVGARTVTCSCAVPASDVAAAAPGNSVILIVGALASAEPAATGVWIVVFESVCSDGVGADAVASPDGAEILSAKLGSVALAVDSLVAGRKTTTTAGVLASAVASAAGAAVR